MWVALACLGFLGIAAVSVFGNPFFRKPFDRPKPVISWTPHMVIQSIPAGTSTNVTVSLSSSEKLTNVCLHATSSLRDILDISPTNIPVLAKGQSVSITLTVHPSAAFPPKVFEGAIHVRAEEITPVRCDKDDVGRDDDTRRVVGLPLPVVVKVVWVKYTNAETGIQISYPDFGLGSQVEVSSLDDGGSFLDVQLKSVAGTNFVSAFGVSLFPNPGQLSLPDWFHLNIDTAGNLIASGAFLPLKLANGTDALVLSGPVPEDEADTLGPVMAIFARSRSGNTIIGVDQSQVNEFKTYGLTRDEVRQLLLQVAGNLQVP